MIYRDFKGIKLSALGLGMMRFPVIDGDGSKIDENATEAIIDYAYQNGINYFDTAWGYHGGNSERVAGKFLSKYHRETYYLATKFPGYDISCFGKTEEIFEEQLKKCQTEYFDFYLCHNVCERNIDWYLNSEYNTFEYLLEQKKKGRIRHLGFSTHGSRDTIQRFLKAYGEHLEFCQLQLNYMDWHFQNCEEKVALVKSYGLPVWVMEPVRGGRLVNVSDDMKALMLEMRPEETAPGWAFRFIQSLPEVTMVLSGMSNLDQLRENMHTYSEDKPLNAEEKSRLLAQIDSESKKIGVPCTACSYCTAKCPMKLDIPNLIKLFNALKGTDTEAIEAAKEVLTEENHPSKCLGCRSCEQVCPQGISISEIMTELNDMLA